MYSSGLLWLGFTCMENACYSRGGGGGGGGSSPNKVYGGVPLKWVTFSQKKSLNMGYGFAEKSLNMGCSFVILL